MVSIDSAEQCLKLCSERRSTAFIHAGLEKMNNERIRAELLQVLEGEIERVVDSVIEDRSQDLDLLPL